MKTTITFYSGLDTIGAVIMEVRYGKDRVFFEAGTAFNPAFDMFDSKVDKRTNFISDYLWVNEMPKINGIFRKEDIKDKYPDLKSASECDFNQAFFITHLHLDHMRMMGMIDPNIPVYLTKPAQIIESALEDIGLGVDTIRGNQYTDIPEDIAIGNIKIHKFVLNDDSYQDLSFYIETPDLKIHYTGDIFVYGKYLANIQKEIDYINTHGVDILIPEGTTFWADVDPHAHFEPTLEPENLLSKKQQEQRLCDIINNYPGLVLFNYYEREMSDVLEFFNYEKLTGRTLVFEPHSAYIINKFFNKKVNYLIPDTYYNNTNYLNEVRENNNLITKEDILAHPEKYFVQISYENTIELLDYRNTKTLYLHYAGTPIGEFDPKFKTLMTILNSFNIDYISRSNFSDGKFFSSHALPEQLLAYQQAVNCKLIVPVHSANRRAYINNITKPYYYANLMETYEYDKENNSLKVIDNE